jgi:hypothetical protein
MRSLSPLRDYTTLKKAFYYSKLHNVISGQVYFLYSANRLLAAQVPMMKFNPVSPNPAINLTLDRAAILLLLKAVAVKRRLSPH